MPMLRQLGLGLVLLCVLGLLPGCGGSKAREAEAVVRAWSDALNANDNEAAADLFAPRAIIVIGLLPTVLRSPEAAVHWHSRLECAGKLVGMWSEENVVTASFRLADRPTGPCGGTGLLATVVFHIQDGSIMTWELTAPRSPDEEL